MKKSLNGFEFELPPPTLREAAKKVIFIMVVPYHNGLPPLPPLELMAVLKYPETDFEYFSPPNFWTKRGVFLGKYCNKPVKHPPTNFYVICPYVDKLSKIKHCLSLNTNKVKQSYKKRLFSS